MLQKIDRSPTGMRAGRPPVPPARDRLARALTAGTIAVGAITTLRALDVLTGPTALVVAVVLALAVPTSRQLSRRLLLAGTLLLGWVPVLWWAPFPTLGLGRTTLLLAATAGALSMWVAAAEHPLGRLRLLAPRLALVDLLPIVAAGAVAGLLRDWWRVATGETALAFLAQGWDNSAHFNMVNMVRMHGATIDSLAAPGATTWKFTDYPQSFHVAVAAVMELTGTVAPVDAGTELVAYVHALGLLAVLGVAMLVAGLCALPALRARPLLAAPLTVLVAAGYSLGPGSIALYDGFPNFFLACTLASAAVLVAAPLRRFLPPVHLAAIGGALVAVTHTWVLLGTVTAPVALLALVLLWRRRGRTSRRTLLVEVAIVVATVLAMARAVLILLGLGLGATEVLTTPGGIVMPDLRVVGSLAVVAAGSWLALGLRGAWAPSAGRTTARWIAAVPALGLITTFAVGAVQLHNGVALSYYFWKYATGIELVAVVVLAAGLASLAPRRAGSSHLPRASVAGSALACLLATQAFGLVGPGLAGLGIAPAAPGAVRFVGMMQIPAGTQVTSARILAATERQATDPAAPLVFLEAGPAGVHPVSAQQWLLALTGRWTAAANGQASLLLRADDSLVELTAAAERVLTDDPESRLVVSGELSAGLLEELARPPRAIIAPAP